VEEKQPVMSLTGDSFDIWSTPTISEVEKVGFKLLFLSVGLFLEKGRRKGTGRSDTQSKLSYLMPGNNLRFVTTHSYNISIANSHYSS
jgi:hypothetical protein